MQGRLTGYASPSERSEAYKDTAESEGSSEEENEAWSEEKVKCTRIQSEA